MDKRRDGEDMGKEIHALKDALSKCDPWELIDYQTYACKICYEVFDPKMHKNHYWEYHKPDCLWGMALKEVECDQDR